MFHYRGIFTFACLAVMFFSPYFLLAQDEKKQVEPVLRRHSIGLRVLGATTPVSPVYEYRFPQCKGMFRLCGAVTYGFMPGSEGDVGNMTSNLHLEHYVDYHTGSFHVGAGIFCGSARHKFDFPIMIGPFIKINDVKGNEENLTRYEWGMMYSFSLGYRYIRDRFSIGVGLDLGRSDMLYTKSNGEDQEHYIRPYMSVYFIF